jgi:UDP-N-acetylglucosamine 2-epimerase (non-hydrolysing)
MKRKKILVAIGTRPEAIKLAPLVEELNQVVELESVVVSTSQQGKMLDLTLKSLNLQPSIYFPYDLGEKLGREGGDTLSDSFSRILDCAIETLQTVKPSLVCVQGDTTSATVFALAAFLLEIPVAHIEAGLRTNNLRAPFPEEGYRRVIDAISDLTFAPTKSAQKRLQKEGHLNAILSGNTVIDSLNFVLRREEDLSFLPESFDVTKKFVLVTQHRRETSVVEFKSVLNALCALAEKHQVLLLLHHSHNFQKALSQTPLHPRVYRIDPVCYPSFISLLNFADLVITDSGGIQEEITALGINGIVTRKHTEREEALGKRVKLISSSNHKLVEAASKFLQEEKRVPVDKISNFTFGRGNSSSVIVKEITKFLD